jgi:hypothetical protein
VTTVKIGPNSCLETSTLMGNRDALRAPIAHRGNAGLDGISATTTLRSRPTTSAISYPPRSATQHGNPASQPIPHRFHALLQYSDFRELRKIATAKTLWDRFEVASGTNEYFGTRCGQIAEFAMHPAQRLPALHNIWQFEERLLEGSGRRLALSGYIHQP